MLLYHALYHHSQCLILLWLLLLFNNQSVVVVVVAVVVVVVGMMGKTRTRHGRVVGRLLLQPGADVERKTIMTARKTDNS